VQRLYVFSLKNQKYFSVCNREENSYTFSMSIFSFLLDILSKKNGFAQESLAEYLETLEPYPSICHVTKRASEQFIVLEKTPECSLDKLIVGFYYREEMMSQAIKNAKFYGQYTILYDFVPYLSTLLLENITEKKEDVILASVPMYFWKKLKRGYNPSEIVAKNVAKSVGISYREIVKKTRSHAPQSHLKKTDRLKNISNSFVLREKYIPILKDKTVILVDDVVSTGATLSEIAKLLRQAGVQKVYGLCIASN